MVTLKDIRASNASLKSLSPNLVAVFVGGTSGIGLTTAREFVRNTTSPHVYLIGRNESEANRIIPELQSLNASSKVEFVKSDVSLLKNVDQACKQIAEKEKKVNLLFMTMGYLTLDGSRSETAEGLDRKFSLHYYARMRFTQNLLPLLTAASNDPDPKANLSRVVSVLDSKMGRTASLNFSDLSLKSNFSLKNCASHTTAMNNYALEHFAQTNPGTSFIHAYPSFVMTNLIREVNPIVKAVWSVGGQLIKPFAVNVQESGERHLFAATAPRFAPRGKHEEVQGVAKGSDEVVGSGAYNLNWDGDTLGESKKAAELRVEGVVEKVWKHTEELFGQICEGDGKH